jgi:hypothetical protein
MSGPGPFGGRFFGLTKSVTDRGATAQSAGSGTVPTGWDIVSWASDLAVCMDGTMVKVTTIASVKV